MKKKEWYQQFDGFYLSEPGNGSGRGVSALIDYIFGLEEPEVAMFTVALLNALGRETRGERPTEVVLMLAFGSSGTAERGRNRLMRWRRGEMSGHDLAREPGLGE